MEGLTALNQSLIRGLSPCCRVFVSRAHFSPSLPLLEFMTNVSLLNISLDPACTERGLRLEQCTRGRLRRPLVRVLTPSY